MCFLIDLPRNSGGQRTDPGDLTPFAKELIHFLTAMTLDQKVIDSLRKFDFSRTANLAFVHSMYVLPRHRAYCSGDIISNFRYSGGAHTGADIKRTGYCGLGTAVQKLGLHTEKALNVDFVVCNSHTKYRQTAMLTI